MNPTQKIRDLAQRLPPHVRTTLRQLVPLYRARVGGSLDPHAMEVAAASLVRFRFPAATPADTDLLAMTLVGLSARIDGWQDKHDSLAELSEERARRMHALMERMAAAQRLLSEMMKKTSETSSSIIGNMK